MYIKGVRKKTGQWHPNGIENIDIKVNVRDMSNCEQKQATSGQDTAALRFSSGDRSDTRELVHSLVIVYT
jgi:hypothetical protein